MAELTAFERGMVKLHAEHGSTDYDITTPFGMKLATTRRHAIRLVRYAVPKAVKAKREALARLDGTLTLTGMQLDSARAVLADSLASNIALRYSLATAVAKVDILMIEVSRYKTAADSLTEIYSVQRVILLSTLSKADETIAAKNLAIEGWRKAASCTIFGFKCPTRTQTFALGAIATGALVIALR